jgi:hypothetical protein
LGLDPFIGNPTQNFANEYIYGNNTCGNYEFFVTTIFGLATLIVPRNPKKATALM